MKKMILLLFSSLQFVHLKKDVGLFPIYLKKYFEVVELLCFEKEKTIPDSFRNIIIKKISNKSYPQENKSRLLDVTINIKKIICALRYFKRDKTITHLMLFHATIEHLLFCHILKSIFPNLKIYIKFDTDYAGCKKFSKADNFFIKLIRNKCIPAVDLFTVETQEAYEILKQYNIISDKIFFVPNGYDNELLAEIDINNKNKQIITVGRLGTYQKNTELLLSIISDLQLKDWTVLLIGPIENSFKSKIDNFYQQNPKLKEKVFFLGNISEEKKLVEIYRKSSIFVLTSRDESSGLVLLESAINGDYILSTEVGAIKQISSENNYCFISYNDKHKTQNESKIKSEFVNKLQEIINGDTSYISNIINQIEYCKSNFLMSNIIDLPCFIKWVE